MNVLHLLYSNKYGGAENIAIQIIKSTESFSNSCYVSRNGVIEDKLKDENIEYELVEKISYFSLKEIVKKYNIEIIHAHDFRASILASFFSNKCKVISHLHQCPVWFDKKNIRTLLFHIRSNKFDRVLVTSNQIIDHYPFSNKPNFYLFDNFVTIRKESKVIKKYNYCFVGRLESEKNPFEFLDFVKKTNNNLNSLPSVMVGSGTLFDELKTYVEENKMNVELVGFKKNPHKIIQESYFSVNVSDREGFGLAVVESMALGTPIIIKKNVGISFLLNNNNSLKINDEKRIFQIYNDPELYNKLVNESVSFSKKYTDRESFKLSLKEIYSNAKKSL